MIEGPQVGDILGYPTSKRWDDYFPNYGEVWLVIDDCPEGYSEGCFKAVNIYYDYGYDNSRPSQCLVFGPDMCVQQF